MYFVVLICFWLLDKIGWSCWLIVEKIVQMIPLILDLTKYLFCICWHNYFFSHLDFFKNYFGSGLKSLLIYIWQSILLIIFIFAFYFKSLLIYDWHSTFGICFLKCHHTFAKPYLPFQNFPNFLFTAMFPLIFWSTCSDLFDLTPCNIHLALKFRIFYIWPFFFSF